MRGVQFFLVWDVVDLIDGIDQCKTMSKSSIESTTSNETVLFDKHGGFRRLHTFTLATIVQLETFTFCRRFLTYDSRQAGQKFYDPKGRQYDQMTQAARSGRQNIIEGSERSSTSKDTEMKLTDVARASLSELRGDYEIFILDRGELPWSVHSPEAKKLNAISLEYPPFKDDVVHESAKHALRQRKLYSLLCRGYQDFHCNLVNFRVCTDIRMANKVGVDDFTSRRDRNCFIFNSHVTG